MVLQLNCHFGDFSSVFHFICVIGSVYYFFFFLFHVRCLVCSVKSLFRIQFYWHCCTLLLLLLHLYKWCCFLIWFISFHGCYLCFTGIAQYSMLRLSSLGCSVHIFCVDTFDHWPLAQPQIEFKTFFFLFDAHSKWIVWPKKFAFRKWPEIRMENSVSIHKNWLLNCIERRKQCVVYFYLLPVKSKNEKTISFKSQQDFRYRVKWPIYYVTMDWQNVKIGQVKMGFSFLSFSLQNIFICLQSIVMFWRFVSFRILSRDRNSWKELFWILLFTRKIVHKQQAIKKKFFE